MSNTYLLTLRGDMQQDSAYTVKDLARRTVVRACYARVKLFPQGIDIGIQLFYRDSFLWDLCIGLFLHDLLSHVI